eukprot:12305711-Heterocapsa_arctica.AAC.1
MQTVFAELARLGTNGDSYVLILCTAPACPPVPPVPLYPLPVSLTSPKVTNQWGREGGTRDERHKGCRDLRRDRWGD